MKYIFKYSLSCRLKLTTHFIDVFVGNVPSQYEQTEFQFMSVRPPRRYDTLLYLSIPKRDIERQAKILSSSLRHSSAAFPFIRLRIIRFHPFYQQSIPMQQVQILVKLRDFFDLLSNFIFRIPSLFLEAF